MPPMTNEIFAGRYELLDEAPAGAGGRLFEARDTTNDQRVAVKVFKKPIPPGAAERADLEDIFAKAQKPMHPNVLRYYALSLDDGYLVREWVHGFSFLELLRKRRELPGEEAVSLLEGIAGAIDLSTRQGLALGGDFLVRLFAGFGRDVSLAQLVRWRGEPVAKWPDFHVKLNPLSIANFLPTGADDAMNTMVNVRPRASAMLTPVAAFAGMLYELLGGPHLTGLKPRFTPLSALNEAGNAVLRRTIEGRAGSCETLWNELKSASGLEPARKKALPPPLPARRQLRIPAELVGAVQPGTMLKLIPSDITNVPVHLLARPQFKIGRSLYQADFIARVLPETAENEKLTKELGRVHVTAELKGARLVFLDGNGEQPSVNGSSFAGVPLSGERPTSLDKPGVLALYKNYELDVLPLLNSSDLGWDLANESEWPGPNPAPATVSGAVVFTPRRNQSMLRKAVWFFTRLDFTFNARGELTWTEAGSAESAGSFFHHRGQFWMANFALKEPPTIGSVTLARDYAAPLVSGQVMLLGPARYTVEVQ